MKGKVEATIPQRQFENIRLCYEFTNEEERQIAIGTILQDCINLHHEVTRLVAESLGETIEISGTEWRKTNGKWEYLNKQTNEWTRGAIK